MKMVSLSLDLHQRKMASSKSLLLLGVCLLVVVTQTFALHNPLFWMLGDVEKLQLNEEHAEPILNLPQEGSLDDLHFLLYTKRNPDEYQEIFVDDHNSIDNMISGDVKFLIHGYTDSPNGVPFPKRLREVYVSEAMEKDYNVIVLDYSKLVAGPDFFEALKYGQMSAEHSAKLLKFLVDNRKTTWDKIHLIGHSLGGQVVGQIGNRVQALGGMVGRITALDPALPFFDYHHPDNRTTPDDAAFVDIIHTAANGVVGFYEPLGHADFYPNGGRYQRGCGLDLGDCSHGRAGHYIVESVFSTTGFWGRKCDSYEKFKNGDCDSAEQEIMGEHTPHTASGTFFFDTEGTSPFAKGRL